MSDDGGVPEELRQAAENVVENLDEALADVVADPDKDQEHMEAVETGVVLQAELLQRAILMDSVKSTLGRKP